MTGSFNIVKYYPEIFYNPSNSTNQNIVSSILEATYSPNTNSSAGSLDPIGSNVHWIQLISNNYAIVSTLNGPIILGFGVSESKIDVVIEQTIPTRFDFNPFYDTHATRSSSSSFFDRPARYIYDGIDWTAELYLVELYAPNQVRIYNGIQWGWTTQIIGPQPHSPVASSPTPPGYPPPSNPNLVCPPDMPPGSCEAFGYYAANALVDSSLVSFDEPSNQTSSSSNSQPNIASSATVPEPSPVLGLLAVGTWAGISWRKRKNQQSGNKSALESHS